jgi:hypothetical protein
VTVREPRSNAELEEAAQIRADCFYEVDISHILRSSALRVNCNMCQADSSQFNESATCCLVGNGADAAACGIAS